MFYIEILDYYASASGRNGKLYFKYEKNIKKDIVVSTLAALILGTIYWFSPIEYDFSGIDLGFIGIPFLMHAIYTYFQIMSLTIGGKPVNRLPVVIILVAVAAFTGLSYSVLFKNSSGNFEAYQAIWFQLTILFGPFLYLLAPICIFNWLASEELSCRNLRNTSSAKLLGQGRISTPEWRSHLVN